MNIMKQTLHLLNGTLWLPLILLGAPNHSEATEHLLAATPPIPTETTRTPIDNLALEDCYASALDYSQTIAIHKERLSEIQGRFLQAFGSALPRASFELTEKRQDGSGTSSFNLREVPEYKLALNQPLFTGFKEFAALEGVKNQRLGQSAERSRAEQLLFRNVADAFYLLIEQREDLKILDAIRNTLVERIEELKERQRLGRSRPSELIAAQAHLRRIDAEYQRLLSQEWVALHLMEFLTGRSPIGSLKELPLPLTALSDESTYLANVSQRADIQAQEAAWHVAEQEIKIAQSGFWPHVSLEGSYYTRRAGVSSGIDWDTILKVNVPIFQGGQVRGAVREASARARQAKRQLEQLKREATLDIRDAYASWKAGVLKTEALAQVMEAAEANYQFQVEEYRLNLVNNLEVLQTLQALQDARREYLHTQYETKRLFWNLQIAAGDLRLQ